MRITSLASLAGAAALSCWGVAAAQTAPVPDLEPIRKLQPAPRGVAAKRLPVILDADRVRARPDLELEAEGTVRLRQGGTSIAADRLTYDQADDLARATGNVRIVRDGASYAGTELQLHLQRFEGWFLNPTFEFPTLGTGGRADRIDFIDPARSVTTNALYTSCPRDGSGDPAWVLSGSRIQIDRDANEGIAEDARLRFLGTTILAWPRLTFPLSDARKSGWLPPDLNIDNRSGIEVAVPYYWNIAPNRDATITPRILTRRGAALDGEFRYLEPDVKGTLAGTVLPRDHEADRTRAALSWLHDGTIGGSGLRYGAHVVRVSDSDWWKDFPDSSRSLTPRLLPNRGEIEQPFAGDDGLAYLRVVRWQVLQHTEPLVLPPYTRSPQLGVRFGRAAGPVEYGVETEYNRFTLPSGDPDSNRQQGQRWHAVGSAALPYRDGGVFVVPKASFNAAAYRTRDPFGADQDKNGFRLIPTFSTDAGMELERETTGFGRALRQTLEPRILYVNTPYHKQSDFPSFDAAAKDFNFNSIYSENNFSGVDRVSDSHQITAGVTTRLVDAASGAEALRLGIAQRFLLRDQRVTPKADGTADGEPLKQSVSDVLLLGSTSVFPAWTLDASLQYNPDISRPVRSILSARYNPSDFHTVAATYRYTRGFSEQLELGWQWPIWLASPTPASMAAASGVGAAAAKAGACGGSWYTVGRVNYSLRDSRITDAIAGFEYDAGCWIARVVGERLSTGRSQATTRLLLQLELVGLSRIGTNPLKVLKDNIPGYKLLREDRRGTTATNDE